MYSFTTALFLLTSISISSVIAVYVPPTKGGVDCSILSHEGDYSYNRLTNVNPYKWGENPKYHMCADGQSQSPIDFPLKTRKRSMSNAPHFNLFDTSLGFHSKVDNWAIDCHEEHKCGHVDYMGKRFFVLGLHFHFPSEHTLAGKQYPLEAHLVHISKDGDLAVLATMFDYPMDKPYSMRIKDFDSNWPHDYGVNPFVHNIFHQLIDLKHVEESRPITTNLREMLKLGDGLCTYNGSLTTPPCSENVHFFMQLKVQTISRQQVDTFAKTNGAPIDGMNRPLQPLNHREVTCFMPQKEESNE